jgi:hypothetical protein
MTPTPAEGSSAECWWSRCCPLPRRSPAGPFTGDVGQKVVVGQRYQANIFADGGVPPWTWAVAGGTLPPGLRLSGNVISGTPTSAGTFSFTIRLSDSRGASTTQVFSITVG